jgi:hypothetical protein
MTTRVTGPNNYKKEISWDEIQSNEKPYKMTVTKGGKTNTFVLNEQQAKNQRKIAKKEAGYKTGGMIKTKAKYGMTMKPTMKKGGLVKKKK